jgi:hypothetical protein
MELLYVREDASQKLKIYRTTDAGDSWQKVDPAYIPSTIGYETGWVFLALFPLIKILSGLGQIAGGFLRPIIKDSHGLCLPLPTSGRCDRGLRR